MNQPSPDQRDEASSDSDGSSVFSEASSNGCESSIDTAVSEDEDSTEVENAIDVKVDTRGFERDGVVPGGEAPPGRAIEDLIYEFYILVRLSIHGDGVLVDFDADLGSILVSIVQVPSITPLNDGSWEILVQKVDLHAIQLQLHEMHMNFTLDSEYDPFEPLDKDVKHWGFDRAKHLYALWFTERAMRTIERSWFVAETSHRHLLKERLLTRPSWMGTLGVGPCFW
ncbi:uncharacterized protein Z519_12741 [Cladophialophora bantiana CBS 173.52]|uniref:Uncharacterized protein n=1 Tax=Cladophialophora bantiana (strain ATCC 10958 / CBS 173.52 / CDC B-1940 / NIH 8579) TaxID=1442370 RepID=A0A0D2E982_CLAB1|nr:uncharacterized protein Z519_12741 [Cladophialophora bantiana CBS 173.52]KIW86686.1 hypothetical protein Z519_12741 [Cladophialophora bantiana CBS 173.52]